MDGWVHPDVVAAAVGVVAVLLIAVIRRLVVLHDYTRSLVERIAKLEQRMNDRNHWEGGHDER